MTTDPKDRAGESSIASNLAYGACLLAFLFWPMLIPGTGFELAVLESSGIALVGYLGLCLWGIYASLPFTGRRRGRNRRAHR